jgi:uncharacterized protein YjbI with pentapeptide repeats
MITQTIEKTQLESSESYQMIKDEHLASVVVTRQILAGSRVLLSTYQQVIFSESVFYACEFQGVTFENCIFENCEFNFTHMRACKFINCSFVDCTDVASSKINCVYEGVQSLRDDHTTDIYIELLQAC